MSPKQASIGVAADIVSLVRKRLPKDQQNRVALLSDGPALSEVVEWIPTGFPAADEILGGSAEVGGGLAVGRISEVFGPEGAGKSAFTHMAIKGVQSIGGTAFVFDYEAALDADKVNQLGIDPKRLGYLVPEHAEQGAAFLHDIVNKLKANRPGAPVLIVWDSIAATPAKEEKEKDIEEGSGYGGARRAMTISKLARDVMLELGPARVHLLFVNQEREAVGKVGFFVEPNVPGGKGIKYAASQRVRVQRVASTTKIAKGKKITTNYVVRLTTKKCRLTPPHQSVELILDFRYGLSPVLSMLHHFVRDKVVKKTKDGYMTPWASVSMSESVWYTRMTTDPEFRAIVDAAYQPVAKAANWINAESIDEDAGDEGGEGETDTVSIGEEQEPAVS